MSFLTISCQKEAKVRNREDIEIIRRERQGKKDTSLSPASDILRGSPQRLKSWIGGSRRQGFQIRLEPGKGGLVIHPHLTKEGRKLD